MRLENELENLLFPNESELHGNLGLSLSTIKVTTRPGYVWVRLLGGTHEIVKAHNVKVSSIYDLPVLLKFDGIKYEITGVDWDRYSEWKTDSSFLPDHASQHSALRGAEGNDILWVDSQQYLPLLVAPVTTTGSFGVTIGSYNYLNSKNQFMSVGGTGLYGFTPISLTDSNMYLVMLEDATGNFYALTGTTFSPSLTGSADVLRNLPSIPTDSLDKPISAVRATPGSNLVWNMIYDLRQAYNRTTSGLANLTGDVVTSGSVAFLQDAVVEKTNFVKFPAKTLLGNVSGTTEYPAYLSVVDLVTSMGMGNFSAAVEAVNESPDGSRTHFTFTHAAFDIFVLINGRIYPPTDVTFTTQTNEFDLAWPPLAADKIKVMRLGPVTAVPDPAVYPDRVQVNAWLGTVSNNSPVFGLIYTQPDQVLGTYYVQQSPDPTSNGDELTYKFQLRAGTYKFFVLGVKGNTRGKLDWYLDNNLFISGQDWYASTFTLNQTFSATGIVVSGSGEHTVRVRVNGKNAAAVTPYYTMSLTFFTFVRTGD